ncbi:hypothetical protein [Sorangium sp. So ce1024]|uniref:hypothetical protein n=1 Tax=unclassified Sorangium TaxID=2621164 RepID=UPI003EFF6582
MRPRGAVAIRALKLLDGIILQYPAPGQPSRRNTDYPFQDTPGRDTQNDKRVETARKSRKSNRQDAKDAKIFFSSWRSWRPWRFISRSIIVIAILAYP